DILCVQEVRPTQVADLARLTDYESVTAERDGDGTGEGIGIYYKKTMFSKVDSGSFWLSLTPDVPSIHPEAEYLRLCLWTVLRDRKGHDFLVIDTHLDNISEIARFEGMKVILERLADKIAALPVLLMGDLNAEAVERVHESLQTIFVNAKEQNEKGHYGPRGSYQNFDYQLPWNQLEEIDYIYTKGFRIIKTGCLTDSCDGRFPSDHFPLEADLRFDER
ncbi:MAG: endonuclease/exonuclease/phosphatase family protein, partial [Enterococcus gallinarum]|nr:endonuclease/exonuclease/phosphatase family protein [Enterococcus gallinarum]